MQNETKSTDLCSVEAEKREERIRLALSRGDAPIKPEFLLVNQPHALNGSAIDQSGVCEGKKRPLEADVGAAHSETRETASGKENCNHTDTYANEALEEKADDENGGGEGRERKKHRGQNKNRKHNAAQIKQTRGNQLCTRIASCGACPFGDNCTFNHNVDEFLKVCVDVY